MKVKIDVDTNVTRYWLWCPGCDEAHMINNLWGFNGDVKHPTFTPSILVSLPANPNASEEYKEFRTDRVCHSFITDGQWKFLTDSTHHLAGKTVPMVSLPKWLAKK